MRENHLKEKGLKMETTEQEIVGYKFISKTNFKVVCKDCITPREKENVGEMNIITKKYKTGKSFLICDRCGKIL